MPSTTNQLSKDTISFKDVLARLRNWYHYIISKWRAILLGAIIGALIGFVYYLIFVPVYTAQTTFVLDNSGKGKIGGYSSIAAQFGLDLGGASGVFQEEDNIIELMKSRNMLSRTLLSKTGNGQELLIDRYLTFSGLKEKWANNVQLSKLNFRNIKETPTILQDSVLTLASKLILRNTVSVQKPDKKLDIIAITTIAPDEYFAKSFTENLLSNVTKFYVETQTKKSQENVMTLRRQTDSVRYLLNAALSGVAVSTDENPNLNPAMQRLRVPTQKRMIDVEMNKAILEELVKNLEIAEITLRKETPLVQVIDSPVLPLENNKLRPRKAIVLGGILGAFLFAIFLTLKKFIKALIS